MNILDDYLDDGELLFKTILKCADIKVDSIYDYIDIFPEYTRHGTLISLNKRHVFICLKIVYLYTTDMYNLYINDILAHQITYDTLIQEIRDYKLKIIFDL